MSLNTKYVPMTDFEETFLVDAEGKPYIEDESFPAGGGLDKRCSYNKEALHCFNDLENEDAITEYLESEGFEMLDSPSMDYEVWEKGDTRIVFEVYDYRAHLWAYVHTEFINL